HTVGVPPVIPPGRIALELAPMPMRRGGATSVTLQLGAPGRVTLEVTDVAGRRVARRTLDAPGGVAVVRWGLGALRDGGYRVRNAAGRHPIRLGDARRALTADSPHSP